MAADVTTMLRSHQEQDEILGGLFTALHTFADRTIDEFYDDTPDLPHPVVAMEKDRLSRLGYYTARDGYTLIHRINLNPYALSTGDEAAETLAHEMVHMWQAHVGRPCERNYHGTEFHRRMSMYGIATQGKRGHHTGYLDDTWQNWMARNADLELDKYVLPGSEKPKTRHMLKHQCPICEVSFRSRRSLNALCMDCEVPFEIVQ